ncbi:hypothetical protein Micbo1qcDRAFT_206110 [Microdochium bolleyi]|uniref:Zn(2)-C6 fungal-type domain-containing protein n=1 Tax=Microdochium bolleyi TaxID=196109 RepID=A0A136IY53_9PEZI|nr:hypothetical protein Micbo1qcDRAFT_206110 [Microdochium bolleyi]
MANPAPTEAPEDDLEEYCAWLTTKIDVLQQCDLAHPACARCRKAGVECQYDEYRNFVKGPPAAPTSTSSIANNGEDAMSQLSLSAKARALSPDLDLTRLPQHLDDPAYQDRYYQLVWDVLLPQGKPSPECQARYPLNSWVFIAYRLCCEYTTLRKSVAATTLSGVGRRDGRPELMELGLKMYVEAIMEVRQHLQTIHSGNFAALIVAARSLAAYEVLYGAEAGRQKGISQVRSWHGHNLGEVALLTSRPAAAYADGHDHQIFVDGRLQLMITACTARKRTFLNDQIWRTEPWSIHPKTSRDLLIDVMVRIPPLLEDYDKLKASLLARAVSKASSGSTSTASADNSRASPETRTATAQSNHDDCNAAEVTSWDQASCFSILEACRRVEAGMVSWWREHAPHQAYQALQARGHKDPTTDELVYAQILTLYWTGCVFLYNTMHMLRLLAGRGPRLAGGSTGMTTAATISDAGCGGDCVERPEMTDHITPAHIEVAQELAQRHRNTQPSTTTATTTQTASERSGTSKSNNDGYDNSDAPSTPPPPPTDPHDPYTYCHHIAEALEAFFQPEAGTFGAYNTPFPMGVSFGYLITATDPAKGMGSPVWSKTVGYFGRGETGKALELFLLGSLRQWQEVARSD